MPAGGGMGNVGQMAQTFVLRWISSGGLMYIMVILVNNTVVYAWNLLRMDLECSHHIKGDCVMDVLISLIGIIISYCMCILNHAIHHKNHNVQPKYTKFLSVNPKSIKLEKIKIKLKINFKIN